MHPFHFFSGFILLTLSGVVLLTGAPPVEKPANLTIQLKDVTIIADKVVQGDADTYGLGTWNCRFTAHLEDHVLIIKGAILFSENANDGTKITGSYQSRIPLSPEQLTCKGCRYELLETEGSVAGPNFGVRGYRNFAGTGLIESARIRTDAFGDDAGQIGGSIRFRPVELVAVPVFAALENWILPDISLQEVMLLPFTIIPGLQMTSISGYCPILKTLKNGRLYCATLVLLPLI